MIDKKETLEDLKVLKTYLGFQLRSFKTVSWEKAPGRLKEAIIQNNMEKAQIKKEINKLKKQNENELQLDKLQERLSRIEIESEIDVAAFEVYKRVFTEEFNLERAVNTLESITTTYIKIENELHKEESMVLDILQMMHRLKIGEQGRKEELLLDIDRLNDEQDRIANKIASTSLLLKELACCLFIQKLFGGRTV